MLGDFFNEDNPQKGTSLFTSPNHASPAVLIHDSTSWVLHPLYAKDEWKGQGRQDLLNQVRYNNKLRPVADYPINQSFKAPDLPSSGIPWMVPKSDYFSSDKLHPEWSFLGYTAANKHSLTVRQGWLKLSPKSITKANFLCKNDGEHNYSLSIRFGFSPKSTADEAGLQIMRGDETKFVKLFSALSAEGKKVLRFSFEKTQYDVNNEIGDTLWFRMIRVNHNITGYYSSNGENWFQIGKAIDVSDVDSYSDNSSFTGTRQGIFVKGQNDAWFDLYIYRDAFSPILAECPANQFGTSRSSMVEGIRYLDNIHPNDWALYAGVEFGNGEYYQSADSVEFTAACAYSGGVIEVWADSIGTGTKLGECTILPTGSWSNFKKFKAPVLPVTGNHDVYLNFTGAGTAKLFLLSWVQFSRWKGANNSNKARTSIEKCIVFPNPAGNHFYINAPFVFQTIEIFNSQGQLVFAQKNTNDSKVLVNTRLSKGVYLARVCSNLEQAVSKLIIE